MSDSILDGWMLCSITGDEVFSDETYFIGDEMVCPCHGKPVKLKKGAMKKLKEYGC